MVDDDGGNNDGGGSTNTNFDYFSSGIMNIIMVWMVLIPHTVSEYRHAISCSSSDSKNDYYWNQTPERQKEAFKQIWNATLEAIGIFTVLILITAILIPIFTTPLDERMDSMIHGMSLLLAGILMGTLSIRVAYWLNIYYPIPFWALSGSKDLRPSIESKFVEQKDEGSSSSSSSTISIRELKWNVRWDVSKKFLRFYFLLLILFQGLTALSIIIPIVAGIVAGIIVDYIIYKLRHMEDLRQRTIISGLVIIAICGIAMTELVHSVLYVSRVWDEAGDESDRNINVIIGCCVFIPLFPIIHIIVWQIGEKRKKQDIENTIDIDFTEDGVDNSNEDEQRKGQMLQQRKTVFSMFISSRNNNRFTSNDDGAENDAKSPPTDKEAPSQEEDSEKQEESSDNNNNIEGHNDEEQKKKEDEKGDDNDNGNTTTTGTAATSAAADDSSTAAAAADDTSAAADGTSTVAAAAATSAAADDTSAAAAAADDTSAVADDTSAAPPPPPPPTYKELLMNWKWFGCVRGDNAVDQTCMQKFVVITSWTFYIILVLTCLFSIFSNAYSTQVQEASRIQLPIVSDALYGDNINDGPVCAFDNSTGDWTIPRREWTVQPITFDSNIAAKNAGYTILHCGACAACSTWHNLELQYTTRTFLALEARDCAFAYTFGGSFEDLVKCMEGPKIGWEGECARCWAGSVECTGPACWPVAVQSFFINTFSNFEVHEEHITSAGCSEAFCEAPPPVANYGFVPCSGANRRRMNIKSDIERPPNQQCGNVEADWEEFFPEPHWNAVNYEE